MKVLNMETSPSYFKRWSLGVFLKQWWLVILLSAINLTTVNGEVKYKCPSNSAYFYPCICIRGGEEGIFMNCENTNLASIAVGLANVRIPIEELRLYRCNIKKLFGNVFHSVQIKVSIENTIVFSHLNSQLVHLEINYVTQRMWSSFCCLKALGRKVGSFKDTFFPNVTYGPVQRLLTPPTGVIFWIQI